MEHRKRIRNNFINIINRIGLCALYRWYVGRNSPLVRILVFHDVHDSEWFERMLALLKTKYHCITPEEFMGKIFHPTRINVLVTFDDGYFSWTSICLPILEKYHIQGVFFVNSGLLDVYDDPLAQTEFVRKRLLLRPRKTLSWEGLHVLQKAGHSIGGHTRTHKRLSKLKETRQRETICRDKERIEAELGSEIIFFAYPFGRTTDITQISQSIVCEAGYKYAFSTDARFVTDENHYMIPRLCLEREMDEKMLGHWIGGGYDLYAKLKRLCVR